MKKVAKLSIYLIVTLTGTVPVVAAELGTTEACMAVLKLANAGIISANGSGEFFCESSEQVSESAYIIVDLHRTFPEAAPDWTGSTKVGWYAVDSKSGAVFEWDIANMAAGKKLEMHP